MPIYNFYCQECGHDEGEKIVKNYDSEVLCPICKQPMVKGLNSGCSFQIDPAVPRGM